MRKVFFLLIFLIFASTAFCQKYRSEKGSVTFFSDGVVEDIAAVNVAVGSLFDLVKGELVFIVPVVEFRFPKALMREHFNEKYMESDKYPKSTFQGKLSGYNPTATGEQKVKATGNLTLHGVTNLVEIPGTMEVSSGKIIMKSKFVIRLQDYKIKIPTIVWQNIAEKVEVKVDFVYKMM